LHTAFLFILLALLHFLEQTEAGWVTVLLSRSPLGDNTRSLLITVILSPFLLGWLTFAAESAGLINSGVARLYFSISVMLLLATVVLYNAQRLFEVERTHQLLASDFQSLQNQMQALIEHSPSPIFIKDIGGRYQLVNSHFENLVNRPRSQIIGKKNETILPQNVLPSMLQSDARVIETKEVVVTEMKLLVDGNQRTYLNTKFPLFDPLGDIQSIGGIWTDISEQKALNESLNVKNVDLERSNKELEQFAYVASHDLQEPLRMVSSYMQLLETRYKDKLDQDAKEFIGYAVDGALRMQRLIQDLLAFSRVGTRGKEPQPVDAGEALEQAKSNLRILIEETQMGIQSGTLPIVLADMDQLAQVFQNLIGNAIKFKGEKQPEIQISVKESNGFAEFTLRDSGIGFDQRHADRIFVLFQRLNTRDKYEGTGIGLAICKKIVERHGGRIWAESQVGKGSTFHFTFPLQEKAEAEVVSQNGHKEELAETIEDRASRLI
jgi:PAS domain S-box-containing protein